MAAPVQGTLEDALRYLNLNDMSGGLVTSIGPLSLGPNQTPDSLNIFSYLGQMYFRGGFSKFSDLPGKADGAFAYRDAGGVQHFMVWTGGNLYDCRLATPALIAAFVYTPGQQIAHCTLNGVLYWATQTVPLRQYDGVTEKAVPNSGGVGIVPPPACTFLLPYAGSLVAVSPSPLGVPQPSAFMWSNVNDPTTWSGTSIQTVGSNDGSKCTFALLMGIIPGAVGNPGVPSTRQLLIGKDRQNLFLYQGALGSLTENAVPCPVGALDANSAVYIPTQQGLGAVMFLGSDGQLYLTNGSTAVVASDTIKNLVYQFVQNALALNPYQRFYATYNAQFQYYLIDFGNKTQLVYKWDTQSWWLFQGWPSGPYFTAIASNGLPGLFCASALSDTTGFFQLGLQGVNDNGADITAYYTTPYLHGGKPEREKIFDRINMFALNVGVQYKVTALTMPRTDGSQLLSQELIFSDPAFGSVTPVGDGPLWGEVIWGQFTWGTAIQASTAQPYPMISLNGRINTLSKGDEWVPSGLPTEFRTGAAQIKIAWNAGVPDFKLAGLSIGMLPRGTGFVGNKPGTSAGNTVTGYNPFS